jgi:hypothetical protein
MNELEPDAQQQWLWFGAALLAMTVIAMVADLPKVRACLPLNPSRARHTCNHNALRSLNPVALWVIGFSHFHDCSDCFRLERLPDGICSSAPFASEGLPFD